MGYLNYLIFVFLTHTTCVKGQLFAPSFANNGNDIPEFNVEQIKNNRIRSVVFDMVDKKDYQLVDDRDLSRHYEFNEKGLITRSYYTVVKRIVQQEVHSSPVYKRRRLVRAGGVSFKNAYEFDTLSCNFIYDAWNNLTCKRYNDGNFYTATYYWYDSLNRVSRMLSCKETNVSPDKSVFMLGVQQVQFDERYRYINSSPSQYKKLCLNDENRVYKEIIVNLDKNNRPSQFNESFTTTWINQVTDISYNENNQVAEKKYVSNAGAPAVELRETYEYKNGLPDTEKHYKNGILLTETGYVYDPVTKLLTSYIVRDHVNKTMQIVKMVYTFY